ncbi:amidase [Falsiroseomonas selenitidurans]|uniref:Amidase n=1 Tax=Falsiroseomonas selenitidurans TaxID=2716335 RepID=A0ABX1DXH4_9PROT|nr:amidase [Falsiroseomonas selenitidurans]NKC29600.1 amidase [Falsiroseomonas selenitidurans]
MSGQDIAGRLDRIAQQDGAIGAFWQVDAAGALATPPGAGPLAGMAIGIKDNVDVAGLQATAGLAALRSRVAAQDAPCVAALRQAGLVILGKLAMHEGALGATTDTPGFGRCMNPLRPGFTPGGSSGGSGAAVAAGFVALALGTDTMGSVRIPAAYCGVAGLKPTAGLVGRSGVVPLSPAFDTVGMLATTPRLAALGVEAMVAEDRADPAWRPAPAGWQAAPREAVNMAGLRIGLPEPALAAPMEAPVREAWAAAAAALRVLGATVVPVPMPGWDPGGARRAGLLLIEAEAAALHEAMIEDPAAASPGFRAALAYGRDAGTLRLARALFRLAEARAAALRALEAHDLLLMPTAPQRAFAHGTPAPVDQADFTGLANFAGLPALAFPWPAADGGLPCSVQLVGRPYAEALLVGVAESVSQP